MQEMEMLEKTHRFCLKRMQGFKTATRTNMVTAMLGTLDIQCEIEKRKLMFLQRICSLDKDTQARQVLIFQLHAFMINNCTFKHGFVPDIVKILTKYNLDSYLHTFLQEGIFPEKKPWRAITRNALWTVQNNCWLSNVQVDEDFQRFRNIFTHGISIPSKIWIAAKYYPHSYHKLAQLAALTVKVPERDYQFRLCERCGTMYTDSAVHLFCSCLAYSDIREKFWSYITDYFSVGISSCLYNLPDDILVCCLLGGDIPGFDYEQYYEEYDLLLKLVANNWMNINL